MEQSPASSCANCCQKEHWRQHKQSCKQIQHAAVTSTHARVAGNPGEDNEENEEDGSDDGIDYSDEDDEDDEDDEYDDPRSVFKPVSFLRSDPFPHLRLSIDGSPVALVDTGDFDEDTDPKDLTMTHAVSTILWNWHPNALRAFLDQRKYSAFEFAIVEDRIGDRKRITHMITRHDRAILIGDYNSDMEWNVQISCGILEDGHWKLLYGSLGDTGIGSAKLEIVESISRMSARDQMIWKRWKPREDRKIELTVGGGIVDPASLY